MYRLVFVLSLIIAFAARAEVGLGFPDESASFVGIYVKDLKTGKVIAKNDEGKALLPASVMKTVTAAAALYTLGENFNFITPVYLYGNRADKDSTRWVGNLVIKSCGDPTIDSELFKERTPLSTEIVNALKTMGISSISGRVIIEESLSDAGCIPQWEIDDVAWAYGAGLYGFNYHDNYYSLWPATRKTVPFDPDLKLTVRQSRGGTDLIRGVFSDNLIVYGGDIKNPKWKTNVSMNSPAVFFTEELTQTLKACNISLDNGDYRGLVDSVLLMKHVSPKLNDMLRKMMHESHNLYAEAFLRALSPGESRDTAIATNRKVLNQLGIDTKCNTILDGSGLARGDRLQAVFISNVLERAAKGKKGAAYVSLFPRAGKEGTVKSLMSKTSLAGMFAFKSGSMSGVQCYAGYKLDEDGKPTHTVVILVNSFFCQRAEVRAAIEKFLLDTFKQE